MKRERIPTRRKENGGYREGARGPGIPRHRVQRKELVVSPLRSTHGEVPWKIGWGYLRRWLGGYQSLPKVWTDQDCRGGLLRGPSENGPDKRLTRYHAEASGVAIRF